ncbi:DUF4926 domain-containing protein [Methylorubrum suomiense]|uniref:DUF4926 domain-containing protein n=1 Tax=Methylorubrum suomiense TaxID=144191 RepID=A0ABQ4UP57_9HYPH|nr:MULTISPECIES: DUF4926 domain-containing protein [Methylobacteriaceae]GJE74037.1 hypothetical protein BGCPKDLD_0604 [Methylorubrum suomiense]
MTVEAFYRLRRTEPAAGFREFDIVELTADVVTDDGDPMKAGAQGTIVGSWDDGSFEVEFPEPEGALATVAARDLRPVV